MIATPQGPSTPLPVPPKEQGSSGGAFEEVCRTYETYLTKATKARAELLRHYQPKALHAWRVNLRRITATLDRVAHALQGEEPLALFEQLRAFRNATGVARDIDILLDETLPAFMAEDHQGAVFDPALLQALEARRAQLHQEAIDGLKKARLTSSMHHFHAWSEAHLAVSDEQLRHVAAELIESRFHQLHKRAVRMGDGRRHLHRLRTTTKKMRYIMELFQPLFPRHAARHWLDQLADLQTHLGEAHDRITARVLCRELLPESRKHAGIKAFRRWAKQTAATSSTKAEASLEQLRQLGHYWRL
ncbi:CHAD domain-containing protein [Dyella subtropica]|uniref:CHAD domain-containing protein n=1 Tax=Dyella subtropica TaxID=2992127 RepID=UPI00224F5E33|nr:CHAD domain-containing protein [Dyella subtropica]